VFELQMDKRLCDYVVASKGFDFWLNPNNPEERAETEKIFSTKGYGLGTSLMGYHGDQANEIANPHGIGYVASDYYGNGSFWSSFPDKTYTQTPGYAVKAEPGKIYASITWSDGDNIQFDQNSLFDFWHGRDHGTVPVATALSPTLQELNPPLLDWYYSKMTTNDELIDGPTGVQFIYIKDFNDRLFPAWCKLTREWCHDAGFHFGRIWDCPNPSAKFDTYMKTCGFDGIFGEGGSIRPGYPPKLDTFGAWDEEKLFEQLTNAVKPNPRAPVFVSFTPIVQGFNKRGGGYSAIKRVMDRVEAAYPGRYVFLLPKDQFATIRAYYKAYYDTSAN
ncbi:MAG: GxGYxYP domain-containing protein, partial [Limisphaerales bacterium]